MKVIIQETSSGKISFYYASENEWLGKNYSSLDEYLITVEAHLKSQGTITHGIIEESDIPPIPDGGIRNDLFWDGTELAYGNTHLKNNLFSKQKTMLEKSLNNILLANNKYNNMISGEYNIVGRDRYNVLMRNHREALENLKIEYSPLTVVFPIEPTIYDYDLNDYKDNKINELKKLFCDEIVSGIDSDALGQIHKYDAKQHNIDWVLSCVALTTTDATETPLITCDDLLGNVDSKQPRTHTQGQCRQLLSDAMTVTQNMKDKLASLKIEVNNSETETEVDSVVWN